jgi:hypothetical protein
MHYTPTVDSSPVPCIFLTMVCYDTLSSQGPQKAKPMSDEQPSYFSYLLRLWRVNEANGSVWRASLEDPHTGRRMGFDNVESLFTFLGQQLDSADSDQSQIPNVRESGIDHQDASARQLK